MLSCPFADACEGQGCVRLSRPPDIPASTVGQEAARLIAGPHGRVARMIRFACAGIRSAVEGCCVRAARTPGPKKMGLWGSTASQKGLMTTEGAACRRGTAAGTTGRPEWPWVELFS